MYKSERRDLDLSNNKNLNLVPQILTKNPEDCINLCDDIYSNYGYKEINLNFGCPSKTVVSRNKGAGMLEDLDDLKIFLDKIFEKTHEYDISIKTRMGMFDVEEMFNLLSIYNDYPIKELTVHMRTQNEYYKGKAHMDMFKDVMDLSSHNLCYNGDIYSVSDIKRLEGITGGASVPVMLGRGFIANPFLANDILSYISGEEYIESSNGFFPEERMDVLRKFLNEIYEGYAEIMDDNTAVYRMKEIWAFMFLNVSDDKKKLKAIQKSKNRSDYEIALRNIFGY
jgi:tRNA-dihydrouridine synthase